MIDKYYNHDDGSFHPLWLGILILLSVITIIGLLCCLRIKYHSKWHNLFNRPSNKVDEKGGRNPDDNIQPRFYYSYNWPSVGIPKNHDLPDFYTLFRNIHIVDFEKEFSHKKSTNTDEKPKSESNSVIESDHSSHSHYHHHHHHISVPPITINSQNSEVAREFFASIRTSYQHPQHPNFNSLNSYNSTSSLASNYPSSINIHRVSLTQEGNVKFNRTSCFLQSVPYTDGFTLAP